MCRVRGEKKIVARSNIRQEENINGSIRWWIDCFLFFFFSSGVLRESLRAYLERLCLLIGVRYQEDDG